MSNQPKCAKCGDTGFLDCAEPIFCDCGFGLEVAIASAGRSVRERVREAFADLRDHLAALEAAAPTPDEAKVLADIRAAKVLPTFNEIQVLKELRERIQHPLATCHTVQRTNDWQWLSDHEIMVSIILCFRFNGAFRIDATSPRPNTFGNLCSRLGRFSFSISSFVLYTSP